MEARPGAVASSARRIIFQQAGREPIDTYRKLRDRHETRKAFVVHDPALRTAVYSYFEHKFINTDDAKPRLCFENPYGSARRKN